MAPHLRCYSSIIALALVACTVEVSPDPNAPLCNIPAAFDAGSPDAGTPSTGLIEVRGSQVTLRRHALDKKFLLSPAFIAAVPAPTAHYIKPRIVQFQQAGQTLALLDVNPDVIYPSPAADILVRTFEIVAENAQSITFRWDFGLRDLQLDIFGLVSSDMPAGMLSLPTIQFNDSFLASMQVLGDTLELHQIATFKSDLLGMGDMHATAHLIFRMSPLESVGNLPRQPSTRQQGVGYFETESVRPGDGARDFYAVRWDTRAAPVTYCITRDVPADVEQAICEGVLYWNGVAGRELVRVETGADGQSMPPWRKVLIRWVPFSRAPLAYASIQAHPLSGEILAGEIYLPSMWRDKGQADGAELAALPLSRGLSSICEVVPRAYMQAVAAMPTGAASQRGMHDLIRLVVAHEVGHTLGLRHNFAASGCTEFHDHRALHAMFEAYSADAAHPGAQVASSVMDYVHGAESLLLGAHVRQQPLPYDVAAINWGYHADKDLRGAGPFCTDFEARTQVVGCRPHDSGRNPLDGTLGKLVFERKMLAHQLVNAMATWRLPPGMSPTASDPWRHMDLSPLTEPFKALAGEIVADLSPEAQVLSVRRQTAAEGDVSCDTERLRTRLQLMAWLNDVGGLPGVLQQAYGMHTQDVPRGWLRNAVAQHINSLGFAEVGVATMRANAPALADRLEQAVLRALIEGLTHFAEPESGLGLPASLMPPKLSYDAALIDGDWQAPLGELAATLLLTPRPEAFHHDLRLAAVRLLDPQVFGTADWNRARRAAITVALEEQEDAARASFVADGAETALIALQEQRRLLQALQEINARFP